MSDSDKIQIPETAKDIGIAIGSVLLVFLLTFAYSGNWPPMVVIESGSTLSSKSNSSTLSLQPIVVFTTNMA